MLLTGESLQQSLQETLKEQRKISVSAIPLAHPQKHFTSTCSTSATCAATTTSGSFRHPGRPPSGWWGRGKYTLCSISITLTIAYVIATFATASHSAASRTCK